MKLTKNAFTMIEAVIVFTIIAVLAAGIYTANNLVRQAKINTIVEEVEGLERAIDEFTRTYGALPGDMSNATEILGATENGNGDGYIAGSDAYIAFQHLALAGLINGTYNGSTDVMKSTTDSSVWIEISSDNSTYPSRITVYQSTPPDYGYVLGYFTATEAYSIDSKYDDGLPNSGNIIGLTGDVGSFPEFCESGSDYNISSAVSKCIMSFKINSTSSAPTSVSPATAATTCYNGSTSYAVGATLSTRINCSNYGFAAKAINEICRTGGYWEVVAGQVCP